MRPPETGTSMYDWLVQAPWPSRICPDQVILEWTLLEQKMGDATWLDYQLFQVWGTDLFWFDCDEYTGHCQYYMWAHLDKGFTTQMLRAFTAIANDGVMLEPKFISAFYIQMTSLSVSLKSGIKAAASSTRTHGHGRNRSCLRYHVQPQHRKAECHQIGRMSPWKSGTARMVDVKNVRLPDRWNQLYLLCCVNASCRKSWPYPLCDGAIHIMFSLRGLPTQSLSELLPWKNPQSSVNCGELRSGQQDDKLCHAYQGFTRVT